MKKLAMILMIGFAVSLFWGCGGSAADDYFPLKEGLSRTYSIDGATVQTVENFKARKLEKKKVIPQKIETNGSTSFIFIRETSKGQMLYAKQASNTAEPVLVDTTVYIYKEPFKPGTKWGGDITTTVMMETVTFPLNFEVQKQKETVTVPAGTFEKCVKVVGKGEIEREKGLLGTVKVTIVKTDWYAPKVGLVKSVFHKSGNHMLVTEVNSITQLTGYKK
jgi:hypothetical protein